MASLIQDLERDALDPAVRVSDLLRKALVVAQRSGNAELEAWVERELSGYPEASDCPEYRWVSGQVMVQNPFHGWQPVIFESDEEARRVSRRANGQPVAEIENVVATATPGSTLGMPFPDEIALQLIQNIGLPSPPTLIVQQSSLAGILDGARNVLLRWVMKLQGDAVKQLLETVKSLRQELAENVVGRTLGELSEGTDSDLALQRLTLWLNRACATLEKVGLREEASRLRSAGTVIERGGPKGTLVARQKGADTVLQALAEAIEQAPDFWRERLSQRNSEDANATASSVVFLGHGGNALWALVQRHLEKDLKLTTEAYESESRAGHHTVDVLKGLLDRCGFAVIVVTAEDKTAKGDVRARQNVVHEIGLFQGRLGFEKVALLMQEGVEEFSNLAGLQHIPFKGNAIDGAFYRLDEMLRREKLMK